MTVPRVVVAGRPNVGKSTLVNRFVGRRAAVVEEKPGVTRDRLDLEAEWRGRRFTITDTGGWLGSGDSLDAKVAAQVERALSAADAVLLVVDTTVGVTTEDEDVARLLKRVAAPVLLVANKVDNDRREVDAWEFVSLGFGDPHMVSAMHGRGTGELLDDLLDILVPAEETVPVTDGPDVGAVDGVGALDGEELVGDPESAPGALGGLPDCPAVAIVGRPNVGKSTLFNKLIGEERAIVHDLPGTTRDAIDTVVETPDGSLRFVDTAGMRRPSRTDRGTEYFSVVRALDALDRSDVVLLVIDATEGVSHQDQRLAERVSASGSPAVVILNKWELVDTERRIGVLAEVGDRLAFLGTAPVLKVSARRGTGVHKILPAVRVAVDAYHRRIPTSELNRAMRVIQSAHPAPGSARIRYAVQGAIDPPTFVLFSSRRLPTNYLRYVERAFREHFDIGPTPIKLRVRAEG